MERASKEFGITIDSTRRVAAAVAALLLTGCGGSDEREPGSERAAVLLAAREHVGQRDARRTTYEVELLGARATVTITFHALRDDSIRDERHVVSLERASDGDWDVTGDHATRRCWPGRGHDDFRPELCV